MNRHGLPRGMLLCALVCVAPGRFHDASQIADRAAAAARSINSVVCEFDGHPTYRVRYSHQGSMFRVELFERTPVDSAVEPMPVRINTFDGNRYYRIAQQQSAKAAFIADVVPPHRPVPVTANPLLVSYYWLCRVQDDWTWRAACSADGWQSLLRDAEILSEEEVAGVVCIHVKTLAADTQVELWLSRDYGCVPVKWVSGPPGDGPRFGGAEVRRYKLVETKEGQVLLPLASKFWQASRKNVLAIDRESTVDERTLRVNEPLDRSHFAMIPPHTANILDIDKSDRELDSVADGPLPDARGSSWLVWLNVVVVLALAVAVCAKKLL